MPGIAGPAFGVEGRLTVQIFGHGRDATWDVGQLAGLAHEASPVSRDGAARDKAPWRRGSNRGKVGIHARLSSDPCELQRPSQDGLRPLLQAVHPDQPLLAPALWDLLDDPQRGLLLEGVALRDLVTQFGSPLHVPVRRRAPQTARPDHRMSDRGHGRDCDGRSRVAIPRARLARVPKARSPNASRTSTSAPTPKAPAGRPP